MRRRHFLSFLGGATAWPLATRAQQLGRTVRIGRLSPLSKTADIPMLGGLRSGLQQLGWIEGKNLEFEVRFADGRLDRLPAIAAELIKQNVDVIVTGSNPGALAAKQATDTIPVVFVTTGNPVAGGLISSLARPGGNLTGITVLGVELNPKRLEMLNEAFGKLKRIGVLVNPGSPYSEEFRSHRDDAAQALQVELPLIEVNTSSNLPAALGSLTSQHIDGLLVLADIIFLTHREAIIELVAKQGIPAIYPDRAFTLAGGLMFYGAGLPAMYYRAATVVDKILGGAKAADIPVEQPTKFDLVINLRTAKTLGLTVSPSILARADEVIE
jgi:putative ABC transport system substrate-binding protein